MTRLGLDYKQPHFLAKLAGIQLIYLFQLLDMVGDCSTNGSGANEYIYISLCRFGGAYSGAEPAKKLGNVRRGYTRLAGSLLVGSHPAVMRIMPRVDPAVE